MVFYTICRILSHRYIYVPTLSVRYHMCDIVWTKGAIYDSVPYYQWDIVCTILNMVCGKLTSALITCLSKHHVRGVHLWNALDYTEAACTLENHTSSTRATLHNIPPQYSAAAKHICYLSFYHSIGFSPYAWTMHPDTRPIPRGHWRVAFVTCARSRFSCHKAYTMWFLALDLYPAVLILLLYHVVFGTISIPRGLQHTAGSPPPKEAHRAPV